MESDKPEETQNSNINESSIKSPKIDESAIVSQHFFKLLDSQSSAILPAHIKNILRLNNFDNALAFRHITEATINELQEFSQEQMHLFLECTDNFEDYYGRFHKHPT